MCIRDSRRPGQLELHQRNLGGQCFEFRGSLVYRRQHGRQAIGPIRRRGNRKFLEQRRNHDQYRPVLEIHGHRLGQKRLRRLDPISPQRDHFQDEHPLRLERNFFQGQRQQSQLELQLQQRQHLVLRLELFRRRLLDRKFRFGIAVIQHRFGRNSLHSRNRSVASLRQLSPLRFCAVHLGWSSR